MASRTAGNITQRGPDAWLVRISLPADASGARRWYSKTIRGTKKDAQRHLTEKLRAFDTGAAVAPTKHTRQALRVYLAEWVETKKASSRTLADYRSLIRRYIAPHDVGSVRLDQLTPLAIRRFYRDLQVRGLAPRTVQYVAAVLRHALRVAVRDGLIARNPESDARDVLEPVVRSEKQVLGIEAARAFLAAVERDRFAALWLLLLETGIRPGEALGLRWGDVEGDVLRVQRALKEPAEKGAAWRVERPKTKRSVRSIPLSPRTVAALRAHRRQQAEERLAMGEYWAHGCAERDLVFTTTAGTYVCRSNLRARHFKPLLAAAGLPDMRIYDLRHSAASLLLALGEHPKVVQERLGHSSIALTMDTYSHVLAGMQASATDRLAAALAASS